MTLRDGRTYKNVESGPKFIILLVSSGLYEKMRFASHLYNSWACHTFFYLLFSSAGDLWGRHMGAKSGLYGEGDPPKFFLHYDGDKSHTRIFGWRSHSGTLHSLLNCCFKATTCAQYGFISSRSIALAHFCDPVPRRLVAADSVSYTTNEMFSFQNSSPAIWVRICRD